MVFLFTVVVCQVPMSATEGVYDFTGFFVGAQMLGSPLLYDISANLAHQLSLTGHYNPGIIFVRPPFWAAIIKPFTLFSHHTALVCWKLLMLTALLITSIAFSSVRRRYTAIALSWSLPAGVALAIANDSPLILLLVIFSLFLWRRGRNFLAGVVLGACLIKFHFLIFLPLLLLRKGNAAVFHGLMIAAVALMAVNFCVQPDWIWLYWRALNIPQPNMNAHPTLMPNFYALAFSSGHPRLGVTAGILLVTPLLWRICRRFDLEIALPACIFGALLASPHTNALDMMLAIPVLLIVARRFPALSLLCWTLLSPAAALLYCVGPATIGPMVFVALCLWLLFRVGQLRNQEVVYA